MRRIEFIRPAENSLKFYKNAVGYFQIDSFSI